MKPFVLLFAHLLADYPLQGPFLSEWKGRKRILMLTHCAIWTGCIATAAYAISLHFEIYDVIFLFLVHYLADTFKASGGYDACAPYFGFSGNVDPLGIPLLIDQAIHVGQLLFFLYV